MCSRDRSTSRHHMGVANTPLAGDRSPKRSSALEVRRLPAEQPPRMTEDYVAIRH